ncbi:MAG TPA: carboxypeptidase-like regulatory domain-containing protein [Gemmataceae bacterium]|nr:carboxypeptidase-like regulatory domain-containing protein [Gemmataceae bacterium]
MRVRFWCYAFFFCSLLALIGCGGKTGPSVKGKVLLDGQPVAGAKVTFEGKGGNVAITDSEGKFFLDGKAFTSVQPGKYVVSVTKYLNKEGKAPPSEDFDQLLAANQLTNSLPAQYGGPEENPLTAEIKDGVNELPPFELKSK